MKCEIKSVSLEVKSVSFDEIPVGRFFHLEYHPNRPCNYRLKVSKSVFLSFASEGQTIPFDVKHADYSGFLYCVLPVGTSVTITS